MPIDVHEGAHPLCSECHEWLTDELNEALALLAEGCAIKTHDLATDDDWVIGDVVGVRALLARHPQPEERDDG